VPARVALLLCVVAGLAAVNGLAAAYPHDPLGGWDEDVAGWVGSDLPRPVEWLARPLSWFGSGLALAALALVVAAALARRGRVADASLVALAYVGAQLTTHLLKLATDRPRPSFAPAVALPGSGAFPSGHAATAMAVLVLVPVLLRLGRAGVVAGAALALAVGLSRIALGVHWTSDVVAGWALGAAWLAGCLLARELARSRR
jgi:undecaprenyl-diphosphatase